MNAPSNTKILPLEHIQAGFDTLREVKQTFAQRGWFPATSGNLSLRLSADGADPLLVITASGKDKSVDTAEDFLVVDLQGKPAYPTHLKPSAETLLHTALYRRFPEVGAVFHIHTVANNLVSEWAAARGSVTFSKHELLKALQRWEEDAEIHIPIVENHANLPRLAQAMEAVIHPDVPAVLIRNHGVTVWGKSVFETKRHLEALEFLFEYQVQRWMIERL
ncbi:methylthioribulose 1-phosphate dehydratase [Desmospora activa]|uniref:Methylthioribulose-1-phosphate dehydratase n=1 Tax=Desmospora activa DSM 45169 TaxID=1121389 RepID=A0A2T4Z1M8_9BACL|nr:methylthioribulose 1-phosphate dehydratase [Desmospora activa]PTM54690.1 methylthioribulose-1-phosphate dehydratase [Desmospora activa DSM 45169]